MRQASACAECRKRKRKCITSFQSHCCDYCIQHSKSCSLVPLTASSPTSYTYNPSCTHKDGQQVVSDYSSTASSLPVPTNNLPPDGLGPIQGADTIPNIELQVELVGLYFDYIHDQFHSIFHPPTMTELVRQGKAPKILVLGMIALSARFSNNEVFYNIPAKERGLLYVRHAERLLNLHDISVTTIQSALLLGAFWTGEGNPTLESVFVSIAVQMASLIDLASYPAASPIEKETNIRIWWSLRMVDVWASNGVGLPPRLSKMKPPPLPDDDLAFNRDINWVMDSSSKTSIPPSSLLSEMVKLNCIFAEIYELHEDTIKGQMGGSFIETRVKSLGLKLDEWYAALPDHMRDTPENLARFASVGMGRLFVAVYCGYYHYGQLLYYQFLHAKNQDEFFSTAASYAVRCNAYSAGLCEIIYAAHSTHRCDVLYNMVGHVLVVASTVQIHTLLNSSSEEEIATTRHRLERNFEIMLRLDNMWPTLAMCLLRLRIFHTACRRSMTETFLMDRWMLRFLRDFGKAVDERADVASEEIPFTLTGIGLTSYQNNT